MAKKISGRQYIYRGIVKKVGVHRAREVYREVGLPKGYNPTRKRAKEILRDI